MVEHLGADVFAHVAIPGHEQPVIVRLDGDATPRAGGTVSVLVDPARVHAFGQDGARIETAHSVRSAA
jgi:hypothetical protein